jgi:uncharacterized protein (TIGR03437 family)
MRGVTTIALVVAGLCPTGLVAQIDRNSFITTFAGASWTFPGNGAAGKNAPISQVSSLNTDNDGNVIYADPGNHVVSRINANGTVTVIAGNGIRGFSGDGGPALSASLNNPIDVVMDSDGNLYISDSFNRRIRKVTPDGIISTLYVHIGSARLAILNNNIAFRLRRTFLRGGSRQNNTLYNTDPNNCLIYQTTPDGTLTTFAGNGQCGHSGDGGPATSAMINPGDGGIAVDSAGNVYLAEAPSYYIRKISPDGLITTIAGTGHRGYSGDGGPALSADLNFPQSVVLDGNGNLIFSDVNNAAIRQVSVDGTIDTIAGTGDEGYTGDGGPASKAQFLFPEGVALDGNGNLLLSDSGNFRIRSIQGALSTGSTSTAVGNARFRVVPDGTPAAQAFIFGPDGATVTPSGNLLVTEVAASKVAQIGLNSNFPFQTLAGNGASGANRGFPAVAKTAFLDTPRAIVADAKGNIYYSDNSASVVYKQTPDGMLQVYAGHPLTSGYRGDGGPATQALLVSPFGIALDKQGNLFIADRDANVIREVLAADGTIKTFAGDPAGNPGFSGDNGPATSARLNSPQNIAIDAQGDLLICDRDNNRIRKVTPNGIITTIAGNGAAKTAGDGGPALQASLNDPFNITVDSAGNIFLLEASGSTLRRIDTSGKISTIAGTPGSLLNSLDGTSAGLALLDVDGMAFDSTGNLYLPSFDSDSIRAIFVNPPVFSVSKGSLSFSGLAGGQAGPSQALGVSATLKGVQGDPGAVVSVASDSPWLKVQNAFSSGATPFNVQVQADPSKLAAGKYNGHISLSRVTASGAGSFAVIPVTFDVGTGSTATLAVQPGSLNASLTLGGPAKTLTFQVLNNGSGSLKFSLSTSGAGASAISLSTTTGTVQAGSPFPVAVTIKPSSLSAGAYSPILTVSSSSTGQNILMPVTIIVAPAAQLALSQRGFLFTAVKGGGVTPKQNLTVLNIGSGSFQWTASAITLTTGGSNWLTVSPSSGSSTAGSSTSVVTVSVDPTKLTKTGVYYGIVRVNSPGIPNAPQDVEIVLNLLSASNSPGAVLTPAGMLFTSPAGTNPSSQTFTITNLNASPLLFRINPGTFDGHAWLQTVPTTIPNPIPAGGSQIITVQPDLQSTGLTPGVYFGTATIDFSSNGSFFSRTIQVLLVVTGGSSSGSEAGLESAAAAASPACKPMQLYPLFTSFIQDFTVPSGWPVPLEVKVVDNCGASQTSGNVAVSFSNGDPLLSLQSLNDGRWQGTYFGRNTQAGQLTMGIHASQGAPSISGTTNYTGTLSNNTFGPPAVKTGGVSSAALAPPQAPLAPGEIITVQGAGFAPGQTSAQLPLKTQLGGNGVFLAGTFVPLIYSSGGLITAVVPYNIKSNAQYLLLVNRGKDGAVSGPEPVAMATAQPGIFLIDASGDPSMPQKLWTQITTGTPVNPAKIAPSNPVTAGDSLVIYCTGLGAVNGTVDVTKPAPANPPAVTNAVSVKIGGVTVNPSFAGLAPGFTGIYQVKIKVPSGITPGSGVPLIVSTQGQSSMPVKLSVK